MLRLKEFQFNNKKELLEREKRNNQELERNLQNKIIQYQANLESEKQSYRDKAEISRKDIQQLEKKIYQLEEELRQKETESEKNHSLKLKVEYQQKLAQQELDSLRH